jgi:hypothetical protein
MNGTIHNNRLINRLMKWPVICGLSGLLLAQTVPAGQDFYINTSTVSNPGNIDATNFVNYNSFSSGTFLPYETTDTRNYTNYDSMNGSGGFVFDTLTSGFRYMASSFYNPGSVTVGSGALLIINVTNIVNPGLLDVGGNGGLFLTGQNMDLSYATLTMEQSGGGSYASSVFGTGDFGVNTNADWDPTVELTKTNATASDPHETFTIGGANYNVYFNAPAASTTRTNTVIRAVFIENLNPSWSNNVYFNSANIGLGSGSATIEWVGTSTDPATGLVTTNYLYLNNDYVLGASTNVTLSANGIPSNFTFTEGAKNANLPTAATPGFLPAGLNPPGANTNNYSYVQAQILATTADTGPTAQNPTGAITNLPARIQISAGRELNLALASLIGPNYLSLTCTNQFDGSAGAQIVSPYSDINLGVTNGFITVSNLLQSVIPVWHGTVTAWSTEWFYTDTNAVYGGTNGIVDFRAVIVQSSLFMGVPPQIQNLKLHGTNLVISDVLNVMNNLSIDAQSLTLTANSGYPNNGSGSPDGELNLSSGATLFATALPNLLWLTNNGAITMGNAGNFGGPPPANYQAFVNNGLLSDSGSTIYASYFQNGGFIENGSGNFFLQSQSTVLTNGFIIANGDIAITADSLVASTVQIQAGRSLTLQVTNLLTDLNSSNNWTVGGSSLVALNLPILPAAGDLLGTTISEVALTSKNVVNTWAGEDRGVSNSGYVNNAAVGRLILDARSTPPHSLLTFNPAGAGNAMYVDELVLTNFAATLNFATSNATALAISPGMVIYYAEALSNGVSVASTINGWNNNRLRWVSSFAGLFSSMNLVTGGVTNTVNAGLRNSTTIDSDGDGIPNASDPTPFFLSSQVNFALTLTNVPPETVVLSWQSIPQASNYVFYRTNFITSNWTLLTNFVTTNLPPHAPVTVTTSDPVNPAAPRYYKVRVDPASP